jgi:nicotinate-nucleotide pyrophosphorylase (carboxylating)
MSARSLGSFRLAQPLVDDAIKAALAEDLGLAGDITTEATIARTARAKGTIGARQPGIVAGLQLVETAFKTLDPDAIVEIAVPDGGEVAAGSAIARVSGNARALLSAERVAMNFLGHLSGVATLTRRYVDAIAGTRAHIVDTRKTTPGLRALEKYAVRCGGGSNHRFGLDDGILIKDNHIAVCGSIKAAIARAKALTPSLTKIEVECDTLQQVGEAAEGGADVILLDNMDAAMMKEAVRIVAGRSELEASGGITLETIREKAMSGVDYISVGRMTQSAPAADIGLDVHLMV